MEKIVHGIAQNFEMLRLNSAAAIQKQRHEMNAIIRKDLEVKRPGAECPIVNSFDGLWLYL
ncbi:hypothetical protein [Methylobacter sp. BlB1]|uniref:hypothetical protein n=1 Tax=Methylobacter sp. BlB1 TaxID=2785914 RepID=UPI00189522E6|nr:hypothetical protein [Methylobacter sp. BlB1]MBF6649472.1 hypothetical protein [Methylobacter sp. BlB1]